MKNHGMKLFNLVSFLAKEAYNFFRESNRSLNNMIASLAFAEECVVVIEKSFIGSSKEFALKPEWDGFRGEKVNPHFPIWIVPLSSFVVSFYDFDFCFSYKDGRLKIEFKDGNGNLELIEVDKNKKITIEHQSLEFFWLESRDEALKWIEDNFFKK